MLKLRRLHSILFWFIYLGVYFVLGMIIASYAKVFNVLFSDEINALTMVINGLLNF